MRFDLWLSSVLVWTLFTQGAEIDGIAMFKKKDEMARKSKTDRRERSRTHLDSGLEKFRLTRLGIGFFRTPIVVRPIPQQTIVFFFGILLDPKKIATLPATPPPPKPSIIINRRGRYQFAFTITQKKGGK